MLMYWSNSLYLPAIRCSTAYILPISMASDGPAPPPGTEPRARQQTEGTLPEEPTEWIDGCDADGILRCGRLWSFGGTSLLLCW